MRTSPSDLSRLPLRAHSLLADVPLHDVWRVALDGGGPGRTVADVRALVLSDSTATASVFVRALFAIRGALGRVFGWDREPPNGERDSYLHRLTLQEQAASLIPPGTRDGPFFLLHATPREAISEVQNATVHAFSVFALDERATGYDLYWAIYVRPVGRLTKWYMRVIDPFRRWFVYPSVLRRLRTAWSKRYANQS